MKLDRLAKALEEAAEAVVEEVCAETRDKAQALCPVETGALRESISAQTKGTEGSIVAGTEYAAFVELGTFHRPARPFLQPAFSQMKGRAVEKLRKCILNG